jgi:hypothetical protein
VTGRQPPTSRTSTTGSRPGPAGSAHAPGSCTPGVRPPELRAGFDWYRAFPQDERINIAGAADRDMPALLRGKDPGLGLSGRGGPPRGLRDVEERRSRTAATCAGRAVRVGGGGAERFWSRLPRGARVTLTTEDDRVRQMGGGGEMAAPIRATTGATLLGPVADGRRASAPCCAAAQHPSPDVHLVGPRADPVLQHAYSRSLGPTGT